MLSEPVAKLLVAQVGHELGAHQAYMGIALYFERESLKGWSKFFHDQATEEAEHAARITSFLIDNGVDFALPPVGGATTTYPSARAAVEAALASEERVTGQFNVLADTAREAADHRSFSFLAWFIDEQVEEERTMHALLDLLDSGLNLYQAQDHLGEIG